MNDPSQSILALTYAISLVCAATAIVVRGWLRGRQSAPKNPSQPESATEEEPHPPTQVEPHPPTQVEPHPPTQGPGKVPCWFYRRGDVFGIFILFTFFAATSLSILAEPEAMDLSNISAANLVTGIIFQLTVPAVVIAAALRLTNLNHWLGLRWKNWPWVFLIAPGAVVLMAVVLWGFQHFGYMKWMESMGVETKQDTVTLLETSKDQTVLALMALMAVVIAPLWEEVVFRGYLYPVLKKYGGAWIGALCSSLLFAAIHNNLTAVLPLFLLAMLLVYVYEATGSIWAPIAIHACFNGVTVFGTLAARNLEPPAAILHSFNSF